MLRLLAATALSLAGCAGSVVEGQGTTIEYNPGAHADSEKRLRQFLHQYLRS